MKKLIFLSAAYGMMNSFAQAQTMEAIDLPAPQVENQITLYQALKDRHAVRDFSNRPIDNQMLSNILWVAYGINRADGRRTIPTAKNEQDLSVYVTNDKGVFLYNAPVNRLEQIATTSLLPLFQTQDYMQNVPLVLIYVGSKAETNFAFMHAGSAYQNVDLYAATNHLGTVVRAWFDKQNVARALGLSQNQQVIVSQAIGYEKE